MPAPWPPHKLSACRESSCVTHPLRALGAFAALLREMRLDFLRGEHPPSIDVGEGFQGQMMAPVFFGEPFGNGLPNDPASGAVNPARDRIELLCQLYGKIGGNHAAIVRVIGVFHDRR